MSVQRFKKDPDAVLDYGIDWSDWLYSSDVISTSTWTVPAGITQDDESKGDTSTIIWLSGGTAGECYEIANKIVTTDGRTDERTFEVLVEER
jgi:hypothetical protein